MDTHDIELVTKFYQYLRASKSDAVDRHALATTLIRTIEAREGADRLFEALNARIASGQIHSATPLNMEPEICLRQVNHVIDEDCGGYSDYSIQFAADIGRMCREGVDTFALAAHVRELCRHDRRSVFQRT